MTSININDICKEEVELSWWNYGIMIDSATKVICYTFRSLETGELTFNQKVKVDEIENLIKVKGVWNLHDHYYSIKGASASDKIKFLYDNRINPPEEFLELIYEYKVKNLKEKLRCLKMK